MRFNVFCLSVVVCGILCLTELTAAGADGSFAVADNATGDTLAFKSTQTVDVTEDICANPPQYHGAKLADVLRLSPAFSAAGRAFVWQVHDPSLCADPLTISFLPPEKLTLSFDVNRPTGIVTDVPPQLADLREYSSLATASIAPITPHPALGAASMARAR